MRVLILGDRKSPVAGEMTGRLTSVAHLTGRPVLGELRSHCAYYASSYAAMEQVQRMRDAGPED